MAHYAFINLDNTVVNVITGIDENIIQTLEDGTQIGGTSEAWEQFYSSFPEFAGLICKRTSYNGNIRANFAGIGYTYDKAFDVFIPQKIYPSWKLNYTTYQWEAPIARPEDIEGYTWRWSETNKEWVSLKQL